MTLITAKPVTSPFSYSVENLFSLLVAHRAQNTQITMKLFTPTVNTRDIPWTYTFLKRHLPSILQSKCFNEENLPFSVEVRRTEIGHLFEHILLEYLCQEKLLKGYNRAVFSGNTQWNWERDPWGMFHIIISLRNNDTDIFPTALNKAIILLRMIILHERKSRFPESIATDNPLPLSSFRLSE